MTTYKNRNLIQFVYPGIAVLVTNFLFYLDEGYYDFRWMKIAGNWIPFVIYVAGMYGGQVLIHYLVALVRPAGSANVALAIFAGLPLGLFLIILLLSR